MNFIQVGLNDQIPLLPPIEQILSSIIVDSETIIIPYYDDERKNKNFNKNLKKIFENLGHNDGYKILDLFYNGTHQIGINVNKFLFNDVQMDYIITEIKRLEKKLMKPLGRPRVRKIIIEI